MSILKIISDRFSDIPTERWSLYIKNETIAR